MSVTSESCLSEISSCFRGKQVWKFEELLAATGCDRSTVVESLARLVHDHKVERLIPVAYSEKDCLIGSESGDVPIFYRWTVNPPQNHPVVHLLHIRHEGRRKQDHGCEFES